jgi:triacylglycerol lipase
MDAMQAVPLPIWQELLVGIEMMFLRISPIYWGYGIPAGDGSAVVVIPCFMGTDTYLMEFRSWLSRIGYRPFQSNMGRNSECPNLLIRRSLDETVDKAYRATRRKVHLIGHSLGGVIARAVAEQKADKVASVISLGAPFRGMSVHPSIQRVANYVRQNMLNRNDARVLPGCYTTACTCRFVESLGTSLPPGVRQTAVYTRTDGIVDWRGCMTGDAAVDFEVSATHIGMVFNPIVYRLVAERLAGQPAIEPAPGRKVRCAKPGKRAARTAPEHA